MITLASVTLSNNKEDIIGDAIRSVVDWVDFCILVDTGITDKTIDVAREIAGDKLVVFKRNLGSKYDMGNARNIALQCAEEMHVDWAIMLDTDERILLDPRLQLRETLENIVEDCALLTAPHIRGTYSKERLFRIPLAGKYVGVHHEYFDTLQKRANITYVQFDELVKSDEEVLEKMTRAATELEAYVADHPEPRWFYYLGDSYQALKQYERAIFAYTACTECKGWDEERAWACYRAAECLWYLRNVEAALLFCGRGLSIHPGVIEVAWLAGYICWQSGMFAEAVAWAYTATGMGYAFGHGEIYPRWGFKNTYALYEGPYEILRSSLRELRLIEEADEAEKLYFQAREKRLHMYIYDRDSTSQVVGHTPRVAQRRVSEDSYVEDGRKVGIQDVGEISNNDAGSAKNAKSAEETAYASLEATTPRAPIRIDPLSALESAEIVNNSIFPPLADEKSLIAIYEQAQRDGDTEVVDSVRKQLQSIRKNRGN